MNNLPLVSVIIPFYNRFDLLKNSMLSIKEQDYKNYEVILIDDCSESQLDIEFFKNILGNHVVIYERLNKNSGPGVARSKGRELASGEYIAYLDSDDLWKPLFLSSTVKKLDTFPNVSMVFTNVIIRSGDKKIRRLNINDGVYDFYDLTFNENKYWATGAAVWRREISLSSNWKPTRDHEDFVHDILSLQYNSQIFHISEILCVVNKNPILGSKRSNIEMLKGLNILLKSSRLFEQIDKRNLSLNFLNFIFWRVSGRNYGVGDVNWLLKTYINLFRWSDNHLVTTMRYTRNILAKKQWFKKIQRFSKKIA